MVSIEPSAVQISNFDIVDFIFQRTLQVCIFCLVLRVVDTIGKIVVIIFLYSAGQLHTMSGNSSRVKRWITPDDHHIYFPVQGCDLGRSQRRHSILPHILSRTVLHLILLHTYALSYKLILPVEKIEDWILSLFEIITYLSFFSSTY